MNKLQKNANVILSGFAFCCCDDSENTSLVEFLEVVSVFFQPCSNDENANKAAHIIATYFFLFFINLLLSVWFLPLI